MFAPINIKITQPIKPTKTPKNWLFINLAPKKKTPTINAKSGTDEFSIEAMAESISVSAYANKIEGIIVPKSPDIANHFQALFGIVFMRLKPKRIRITAVTNTLKAPT